MRGERAMQINWEYFSKKLNVVILPSLPGAECLFDCASFQTGPGTSDNPVEEEKLWWRWMRRGVQSVKTARSQINTSFLRYILLLSFFFWTQVSFSGLISRTGKSKALATLHGDMDAQYTMELGDSWLCGFKLSILKWIQVEGPERDSRKTSLLSRTMRNAPSPPAFLLSLEL